MKILNATLAILVILLAWIPGEIAYSLISHGIINVPKGEPNTHIYTHVRMFGVYFTGWQIYALAGILSVLAIALIGGGVFFAKRSLKPMNG